MPHSSKLYTNGILFKEGGRAAHTRVASFSFYFQQGERNPNLQFPRSTVVMGPRVCSWRAHTHTHTQEEGGKQEIKDEKAQDGPY